MSSTPDPRSWRSDPRSSDRPKRAVDRTIKLLQGIKGIEYTPFQKVSGKTEVYYKSLLKTIEHSVELYIYADEAGFMINGTVWTICEKSDYSSDDELIEAFIDKLKNKLMGRA